MTAKYRISASALLDIDQIWIYTLENWSLTQANNYYRLLYLEIDSLIHNFEKGKDIRAIRQGYRQLRFKSHYIIYRRGADGLVEIVRVLHQMMDLPNKF